MAADTQKTDEMKTGNPDIELISGHTNILLIAPHGVETEPFDDIGTAELTRQIQAYLGCSAVINNAYRKPTGKEREKRNEGNQSLEKKVLNLNLVAQAGEVSKFINSIKEVVDYVGLTYVFWIHGISDNNIAKDTDCLIGYGQPNNGEKARFTAEEETIQNVLSHFKNNGIRAAKAPVESNYRGWNEEYMNQWFRIQGYGLDKVQSIQLEFRKTGCREKVDIEKTATNIAKAISSLIQPETEAPEQTTNLTPKMTGADQQEDSIEVNDEATPVPVMMKTSAPVDVVDEDPLVEKAYIKLSSVFSNNYEQALMEAGQYIVRTFYGKEENIEQEKYNEDFEYKKNVIESARKKDSLVDDSLRQLYAKINENKASNTPSQAWIYNSVNLVVQWQDMKNELTESHFYTYKNLLLSHKICLLRINDIEIKKTFISQIQEQELSVRDLKKLITESKKQPHKEKSMYSVIDDPDELFSDKYSEKYKLKELNNIRIDKLRKIAYKMLEECKTHQISRIIYSNLAIKHDSYVDKYLATLTDIKTVIDYKENPSKDKKLKKNKTTMAAP